jgi:hypothetical protein
MVKDSATLLSQKCKGTMGDAWLRLRLHAAPLPSIPPLPLLPCPAGLGHRHLSPGRRVAPVVPVIVRCSARVDSALSFSRADPWRFGSPSILVLRHCPVFLLGLCARDSPFPASAVRGDSGQGCLAREDVGTYRA